MKSTHGKWLKILALGTPLAVLGGGLVLAQIEGPKRGIMPIASTGDFMAEDIEVNTEGETAQEARKKGWEEAQRLAWTKLWAQMHNGQKSSLSDSSLDGIVSAIVVQDEQIGPHRYIAKLSVVFDRARAGQLLGVQGVTARSAPLLIMPITFEGGTALTYERQNPWQRAWAMFKTAESRIDYVRPSGAGGESLLLNAGQMSRRSRQWWRVILDQFGAADVIFPVVRLDRQYPGGPIVGKFSGRYGPDSKYLGSFTLTTSNASGLNNMLIQGVKQMDMLFQNALSSGRLRADVSLVLEPELVEEEALPTIEDAPLVLPDTKNSVDRELDAAIGSPVGTDNLTGVDTVSGVPGGEADKDAGKDKDKDKDKDGNKGKDDPASTPPPAATTTVSVSVSTATEADLNRAEASLRSIPGVKSVSTSSLALGGTSVMRVTYQGDPAALRSALSARGFR
jgi:hypothetical protein